MKVPLRSLRGIGREMLDASTLNALGRVDWEAPAFADGGLDAMMEEEDNRTGEVGETDGSKA